MAGMTIEDDEAMIERLRQKEENDAADKLEKLLAALRDEAREGEDEK